MPRLCVPPPQTQSRYRGAPEVANQKKDERLDARRHWRGQLQPSRLRACRTPVGFIMTHNFGSGAPGAFRAGTSHGAYCLGCCWALMMVLVVVGLMNLVWMAALAIVFLVEKNSRYGVSLNRVVGTAIALLGVAVLFSPETLNLISGVTGAVAPDSASGM